LVIEDVLLHNCQNSPETMPNNKQLQQKQTWL